MDHLLSREKEKMYTMEFVGSKYSCLGFERKLSED